MLIYIKYVYSKLNLKQIENSIKCVNSAQLV